MAASRASVGSTRPRHRLRVVLVAALLLAAGAGAAWHFRSDPDDVPPPPQRLLAATSTYALLVGCSKYPALKAAMDARTYESSVLLEGPENDVQLLRTTLRDYLGVPDEHIKVLAGWPEDPAARPTKANILGHLARLSKEVPRGGRVVFQFAGHGSQAPDQDQGDEQDRLDELLLPADVAQWDRRTGAVPGSITDDEVRAAFVPLVEAGLSVWAILDCCHAGGGVRGTAERIRTRELSGSLLGLPERPMGSAMTPPTSVLRDTASPLSGVVAFYAVQSSQLAPEMMLPRSKTARDRQPHGLFSFLLARTLMRFGGGLSFGELFSYVKSAYEALPDEGATPAVEGDLELVVSGEAGSAGSRLLLDRVADGWRVDGGSLRGLTRGSVIEAFRPGGLGDPAQRLGTLALDQVAALTSTCRPVPGDFTTASDLPPRCPARLVRVAPGDLVVRLAIVDEQGLSIAAGQHPPALRLALADAVSRARFPLAAPAEADWLLRIVPFDGTTIGGSPRMALEPGRMRGMAWECASDELEEALCRIFRSVALRHVLDTALGKALPAGFQVDIVTQRPGEPEPHPLTTGSTVQPGDTITVTVRNQTYKAVSVSAWYFDANQDVAHIGPPQNLTADDSGDLVLARVTVLDDTFGEVRLVVLVAEVDEGQPPPNLGDVGCASSVNQDQAAASRGEMEKVGMTSVSWRTDWGRMGIPSIYNDAMVTVDPPATVARMEDAGDLVLPGEGVRWTSARVVPGDERRADLLLLWGEGGLGACIDADGDARFTARPADELAREAAANLLPAEVSLFLLASGQRAARYRLPVSLDGKTLFLLDTNSDAQADRRWVLLDGTWRSGPAWGPWLSTSHLGSPVQGGLDAAACSRVAAAMRVLVKKPL